MGRTSDARERLVAAARQLMYGRGYADVGVQEICAAAGVHRGSFYHFFPSKQALALDVIDRYDRWYRDLLGQALARDVPPLQRIRRLFELTYEHHRFFLEATGQVKGCPIGNLALELSTQDEMLRQKLQQTLDEWTAHLEDALREAIAKGEAAEIDPHAGAQAVLAYLEGAALLATTRNDPDLFKQLAARALQLVAPGAPRTFGKDDEEPVQNEEGIGEPT